MTNETVVTWQTFPNWPFIGFGAILAACVAVGLHWHNLRKAERQRFIAACDKFLAAFAPTLGGVKAGNPAQFASHTQEDAAMEEFRRFLPERRRVDFDKACENYREYRKRAYPRPDAFGQVKVFPRSEEVKARYATSLRCLLS